MTRHESNGVFYIACVCAHARASLGHVDNLALAGEDVRPQAQIFVLLAAEIEQQVLSSRRRTLPVRSDRCVDRVVSLGVQTDCCRADS